MNENTPPETSGQWRAMTAPPCDHDTKIPYWARWGYRVAAVVVGAVLTLGGIVSSVAWSWVDLTRRQDAIEQRQVAAEKRLEEAEKRAERLVTRDEFAAFSARQDASFDLLLTEVRRLQDRRP